MRTPLLIVGLLGLIIGLFWFGQGTGYVPYPSSSFMVGQSNWAIYGAMLAVVGMVLIAVSRGR